MAIRLEGQKAIDYASKHGLELSREGGAVYVWTRDDILRSALFEQMITDGSLLVAEELRGTSRINKEPEKSAPEPLKPPSAAPKCPYCRGTATLVPDSRIYGRSFGRMVWMCRCGARVGCHRWSNQPMGTLADAPTRKARNRAHKVFDRLWKKGHQDINTPQEAYRWLAEQLGVPPEEAHIAKFDRERCRQVINLCAIAMGIK